MRILVISTYELGHQPLHAAAPAAGLRAAGHDVRVRDLAVESWSDDHVVWADAMACSVPMHTARRLAAEATRRARFVDPTLHVCWFGLYAVAATPPPEDSIHLIAGEYDDALCGWADDPVGSTAGGPVVEIGRAPSTGRPVPDRADLPGLDQYVHFIDGNTSTTVAAVEASHGCAHRCRHCPVPVIYDGRTRPVDTTTVLADIAQQVEAGARHVTFGDPDFLNRPAHSLEIVREMRRRFNDAGTDTLTFDCTVKVEHILRHRGVWEELAASGCRFVVSAFESADDTTLEILDKGHTTTDAAEAVELLRSHGIEIRPSFLPFLPWTTPDDVVRLVDFVADNDLVANVDPVQYTIRLLVPPGSLLLDVPELADRLGDFDFVSHAWSWRALDPAVDELQAELAAIVEADVAAEVPILDTYRTVRAAVFSALGRADCRAGERGAGMSATTAQLRDVPRLSESWFCCAEPTDAQWGALTAVSPSSTGR
ncbi:MAG: radical SAM protein [Acidimicrobiia bacterium]|nr:radical SAM protein [Acidimicrobiia bacterium]